MKTLLAILLLTTALFSNEQTCIKTATTAHMHVIRCQTAFDYGETPAEEDLDMARKYLLRSLADCSMYKGTDEYSQLEQAAKDFLNFRKK
jgi:hypothetical protein